MFSRPDQWGGRMEWRMLSQRFKRAARPLLLLPWLILLALPSGFSGETYSDFRDVQVRVAIIREARHLGFGVTGEYTIRHAAGRDAGTIRAQQLYFVDLTEGGLIILRDAVGRTVTSNPSSLLIEPVDERKSAIYIQAIRDVGAWRSSSLEKAPSYRGPIRFGVGEDGGLVAVNELPLEYYLLGVVGPEIGNFAPEEALKAQSVAARSEAWAKLKQGYVSKDPLYDFTDASPQVYRGWREENAAVRRAVDATRGQILTWHGQPVDAVYGHSCGGVVAEAAEIWGGAPLAWSRRRIDGRGESRQVELQSWNAAHEITQSDGFDAYCNPHQEGFPRYATKHFRWRRTLSAEDLTRTIDPIYQTGRVQRIEVEKRSASGRVQRLRVVGSRKTVVLKKELHIRGALGNIKSTFFTFTSDDSGSGDLESLHIYGAGYGHGVGMCQMGAFMMAKRGFAYQAILQHYFNGISLESLYP